MPVDLFPFWFVSRTDMMQALSSFSLVSLSCLIVCCGTQVCMDYIVKEFGRVIVTDSFVTLAQQIPELAKEVLTYGASNLSFTLK